MLFPLSSDFRLIVMKVSVHAPVSLNITQDDSINAAVISQ